MLAKILGITVTLVCVWGNPLSEELTVESNREAKILGPNFWDGFEKGIRNTADIIHRVSENIEVAVDQLSDSIDGFGGVADRLEDRVEQSLPPFLRSQKPGEIVPEVEAISGPVGPDGVDDGLKVYYNKDIGATEGGIPTAEEDFRPATTDHHFDLGFQGSIFKPFQGLAGVRPNAGGIFNMFRRRSWWNGPNVCVDKEETDEPEQEGKTAESDAVETPKAPEEPIMPGSKPVGGFMFGIGHMEFSSCQETTDRYACIKSTNRRGISKSVKITYRCCHGFVRDASGCTKVELSNLPSTLKKVGGNDFLALINAAELMDALDHKDVTLFAPTDEAVQEYMADFAEKNEIQNTFRSDFPEQTAEGKESKDLSRALLSHLTKGLIYAGDLRDEQLIVSHNGKSSLRINTYNTYPPTITVNCARILTANQHALNGVVHTTDRVLEPITQSTSQIISNDPQFTILKTLINKAGLMEEIGEATQLTLFAPTDAAFKRLPANVLDRLMDGTFCLKAVLMNHILPNTICSASIPYKARTINMLDEFLILQKDDEDDLMVGDAHITSRDRVTTNGVIHTVDKVLVPQEAKPVIEVLKNRQLTQFLSLIDAADMRNEMNDFVDVTIFAPSDAAFEHLAEGELETLKSDKKKLREIILQHVSASALSGRDINNNHITTTKANQPLRINLYSRIPLLADILRADTQRPVKMTAGCSRVSKMDSRACGAVVHVIERMLDIPEPDVLTQLEKGDTHSMFLEMIRDTGLDNELRNSGPYTILAPSNFALKTIPNEELQQIMENDDLKEKVVRKHILYDNLCCSGINSNVWLFMDRKRAMDSSRIHVRRAPNGRLMAGNARITSCGSPARNGIVHTVNRLLVDPLEAVNDKENRRRVGPQFLFFPFN